MTDMATSFDKTHLFPGGAVPTEALRRLRLNDEIVIAQLDLGFQPHPVFGRTSGAPPTILLARGRNLVDPQPGTATPQTADFARPQTCGALPVDPLPAAAPSAAGDMSNHAGHGVRTLSVMVGEDYYNLVGMAPGAHVIPFRVAERPDFGGDPRALSRLAAGIHAALAEGAKVIAIPLGFTPQGGPLVDLADATFRIFGKRVLRGDTMALRAAIAEAYGRGVIVCCAAGDAAELTIPALYRQTVAFDAVSPVGVPLVRRSWRNRAKVDAFLVAKDIKRANVLRQPSADGGIVRTYSGENHPLDAPPPHSSTAYAAAQGAGLAALWLAMHWGAVAPVLRGEQLKGEAWRVVEAFRAAVRHHLPQQPGREPAAFPPLDIAAALAAKPDLAQRRSEGLR